MRECWSTGSLCFDWAVSHQADAQRAGAEDGLLSDQVFGSAVDPRAGAG
jgi:hypothetical protein